MESALVSDVLDSLAALGYMGELLDPGKAIAAVKDGLASVEFRQVIVQLCDEIKSLNKMEEGVSPPQGIEDQDTFNLEMKGFLQELQCPYLILTKSVDALSCHENRLLLLSYLLSELQTSRLLVEKEKQDVVMPLTMGTLENNPTNLKLFKPKGSAVAQHLQAILHCYGITTPPPSNTPPRKILEKVIGKTKQALSEAPQDHMSKPLISKPLSVEQWGSLDEINDSLTKDYSNRRAMLIMRIQLTAQSFGWSDKSKDNEIAQVIRKHQKSLKKECPISIARVLAAREDITLIQPASRGVVRQNTQSPINKVMLEGRVPDRGGRPNETRPPPEMPSFKQRTEAPQQQRSGRGRGGKVQGGWGGSGKRGGRGGGHWGGSYSNQGGYSGGQSAGIHWN